MRNSYDSGFEITDPVGNNAFSYAKRHTIHTPKLTVPALIHGAINDVTLGSEVVFEEYEEGKLKSCTGLKNFVHMRIGETEVYVIDNHNHALYFWAKHAQESRLELRTGDSGVWTLVHIDQHSDMRTPELSFETYVLQKNLADLPYLEQVFRYTNFHLNIGNFIKPAIEMGIVDEVVQVTGSVDSFGKSPLPPFTKGGKNKFILDIDLDYFAPEMDFLPVEQRIAFIRDLMPKASIVTIATSPYFIDQELAIEILKKNCDESCFYLST